jgi:hypothetical protein
MYHITSNQSHQSHQPSHSQKSDQPGPTDQAHQAHPNRHSVVIGSLVLIAHYAIVIFITYLLLWSDTVDQLLLGIVIWVVIMLLHVMNNGCFLVRFERKMFNTDSWYGPWTSFFHLIERFHSFPSRDTQNKIFVAFGILLTLLSLVRLNLLARPQRRGR